VARLNLRPAVAEFAPENEDEGRSQNVASTPTIEDRPNVTVGTGLFVFNA
jgi:hypothetical protein